MSLMIDSVHIGGYAVVVALGINDKGKKFMLGLRQGATEDWKSFVIFLEISFTEALKLTMLCSLLLMEPRL